MTDDTPVEVVPDDIPADWNPEGLELEEGAPVLDGDDHTDREEVAA